jgi:hypothetical protein
MIVTFHPFGVGAFQRSTGPPLDRIFVARIGAALVAGRIPLCQPIHADGSGKLRSSKLNAHECRSAQDIPVDCGATRGGRRPFA